MKAIKFPSSIEFKFDNESNNFTLNSDDFFNDEKVTSKEYREYLDEMTELTEEEKEFVISELETYEWI